ncbi:hypothetical protein U3516DRAFT_857009, partial [Neocallimastix sp. 'constans']
MIKFYYNIFVIIKLILLYLVAYVQTIEVIIDNDETSMVNFAKIVTMYSNFEYDEIKLIFNENYYKIANEGKNRFNVKSDLIFYSEKGTIFDFQDDDRSNLSFFFQPDYTNKTITFYNISFINYYSEYEKSSSLIYFIFPKNSDHYIEFNNCIFRNLRSLLFNFEHSCVNSVQTSIPQVSIINCKIM